MRIEEIEEDPPAIGTLNAGRAANGGVARDTDVAPPNPAVGKPGAKGKGAHIQGGGLGAAAAASQKASRRPVPKGAKSDTKGHRTTKPRPGGAQNDTAGHPGVPPGATASPGLQHGAGAGMSPPQTSQQPPFYGSARPGGYGPPRRTPGGFPPPPPQTVPGPPPHLGGYGAPPPYYSPYQQHATMPGVGGAAAYGVFSGPAAFGNVGMGMGAAAPPGPHFHAPQTQHGYYRDPVQQQQQQPLYSGPNSPAAAGQPPHVRAAPVGGADEAEGLSAERAREWHIAAAADFTAAETEYQKQLRLGDEKPEEEYDAVLARLNLARLELQAARKALEAAEFVERRWVQQPGLTSFYMTSVEVKEMAVKGRMVGEHPLYPLAKEADSKGGGKSMAAAVVVGTLEALLAEAKKRRETAAAEAARLGVPLPSRPANMGVVDADGAARARSGGGRPHPFAQKDREGQRRPAAAPAWPNPNMQPPYPPGYNHAPMAHPDASIPQVYNNQGHSPAGPAPGPAPASDDDDDDDLPFGLSQLRGKGAALLAATFKQRIRKNLCIKDIRCTREQGHAGRCVLAADGVEALKAATAAAAASEQHSTTITLLVPEGSIPRRPGRPRGVAGVVAGHRVITVRIPKCRCSRPCSQHQAAPGGPVIFSCSVCKFYQEEETSEGAILADLNYNGRTSGKEAAPERDDSGGSRQPGPEGLVDDKGSDEEEEAGALRHAQAAAAAAARSGGQRRTGRKRRASSHLNADTFDVDLATLLRARRGTTEEQEKVEGGTAAGAQAGGAPVTAPTAAHPKVYKPGRVPKGPNGCWRSELCVKGYSHRGYCKLTHDLINTAAAATEEEEDEEEEEPSGARSPPKWLGGVSSGGGAAAEAPPPHKKQRVAPSSSVPSIHASDEETEGSEPSASDESNGAPRGVCPKRSYCCLEAGHRGHCRKSLPEDTRPAFSDEDKEEKKKASEGAADDGGAAQRRARRMNQNTPRWSELLAERSGSSDDETEMDTTGAQEDGSEEEDEIRSGKEAAGRGDDQEEEEEDEGTPSLPFGALLCDRFTHCMKEAGHRGRCKIRPPSELPALPPEPQGDASFLAAAAAILQAAEMDREREREEHEQEKEEGVSVSGTDDSSSSSSDEEAGTEGEAEIDEAIMLAQGKHPVPEHLRCPKDPRCLNHRKHHGRCRLRPKRPESTKRRRGGGAGRSGGRGGRESSDAEIEASGEEQEEAAAASDGEEAQRTDKRQRVEGVSFYAADTVHIQCPRHSACLKPAGHPGWCRTRPPGAVPAQGRGRGRGRGRGPGRGRGRRDRVWQRVVPSAFESDAEISDEDSQHDPSGSAGAEATHRQQAVLAPLPGLDPVRTTAPAAAFAATRPPLPDLSPRSWEAYLEECRRGPPMGPDAPPYMYYRSQWELHRMDMPATLVTQQALRGKSAPGAEELKPPPSPPGKTARRSEPGQFLKAELTALLGDRMRAERTCARGFPPGEWNPLKAAYLRQEEMIDDWEPKAGPPGQDLSTCGRGFGLSRPTAPAPPVQPVGWRPPSWSAVTAVNGTVVLRRARSNIHGYGVFARTAIAAGAWVSELAGEFIPFREANKRLERYNHEPIPCVVDCYQRFNDDEEEQQRVATAPPGDAFMFRVDGAWVVDATQAGSLVRFINHSCTPNAAARVVRGLMGRRHVMVFALRKIEEGEEVTIDYGLEAVADQPPLPCTCGAPECAGRIDRHGAE